MIETMLFNTIGGLGIFMYGMFSMSDSLQKIAGDRLRLAINALTTNRWIAVLVGLFVTATIQSSSVTTVMVVGFVNAGLMQLQQAIGVILGANIGTTVTGWIIAIKITKYALPILGVGIFFFLFSRNETLKNTGQLAMGFGLIFFGLFVMKTGFSSLKADPAFIAWFAKFGAENTAAVIKSVAVGAILTMIVQSSSATLGITITLAMSGMISFEGAAALVLGENIGTTITANLASIGTNTNSKRAARAHLIFNLLGVLFIICVFQPYTRLVHHIVYDLFGWAQLPANTLNDVGEAPHMAQYIAMGHSLFNVINTLIWIPLIKVLGKMVVVLVPVKIERETTHFKFIDPEILTISAIALEAARKEIIALSEVVYRMLKLTADITAQKDNVKEKVNEVFKMERAIDIAQKEITVYLVKLSSKAVRFDRTREIQSLIRAADELESIGDYCESLVTYLRRLKIENMRISDDSRAEMIKLMGKVMKCYEIAHEGFKKRDTTFLPDIKVTDKNIREYANFARKQHMQRLNHGMCDALAGLIFNDLIVGMRRIGNHIVNLAETYVGKK